MVEHLFKEPIDLKDNFIEFSREHSAKNQSQTNKVFSEKWGKSNEQDNLDELYKFQYEWYLKLYGFKSEGNLKNYLRNKKVIFDAGCGLGYKAQWFAKLAPHAIVIGMDYSEAAKIASEKYKDIKNLYFIQGDIAATGFKDSVVDYVSCDQVIMHTEDPEKTFSHLSSITSSNGEFACYVYRKKALPRELVDDYFRKETHKFSNEELWELSNQLTKLGKTLTELKTKIDVPDIPLLGIKGGEYDIQRFIYWNFLKCFWREDWGEKLSDSTNFDWYSPSNAKRYSKNEFLKMATDNNLTEIHFHEEEACYSGRFSK